MSDLASSIFSQLDPATIGSIASQLGVKPAQASNAIEQALPLLLGGLARNSASPQGANALHAALERDHANVDIGGLLGSVLGGGSAGGGIADALGGLLGGGRSQPAQDVGGAILGHIFGGRRERAAQGLGQTSGLGGAGAAQLLSMLAPLVMAALGNMTRKQGLDANALGGLLGQQSQRHQQSGVGGLLSGVLDADGDGELELGEMMQAGAGLLGMFGKR